jgi:protein-S-isoprenylcysteine O-methyltransferase Ste14
MDKVPDLIIGLCWLVLLFYWLISAFSAKRYAKRNYTFWVVRLIIVVVVIAFLDNLPWTRETFGGGNGLIFPLAWQWLGAALCVCGVAFAIWARFYLGTNWGMPMTLKQDPELVTSGPYAYVRHPIYSGFMLAALGSTLVTIWWIVPLVGLSIYFVFSARTEEKIMLGEFGTRYADYMKRSKMLIPFVF